MANAVDYQTPCAGPYACRLALKLAADTVGPVCQKVAECLIKHGAQQFADLLRESGLQAPLLKTALLILIQQNYVACYLKQEPPTLRGPGPKYTLYEVVLPRILQVLRGPRFLIHLVDEHGPGAEKLVRNLLDHGRLRWDQLLDTTMGELKTAQEGSEESDDAGGRTPPDPAVLLNHFRSLVLDRYIERVPPCSLPPLSHQVHPAARKKKAAPKPGSEEEAELHREQAEAAAWQEYQQVRFQLPEDMVGATSTDMEGAPSAKPSSKRKRGNDAAASEEPGKKRGRKPAGAAEPSDEPSPAERQVAVQAEPVLWRVNYDEFNRRLRNELLVETVRLQHTPNHARAVEGLLRANLRFEQTAKTPETVVLSVGEISGALRRVYGKQGVPADLDQLLRELVHDGLGFLEARGSGPQGEQYLLNITSLLKLTRFHSLMAVIRNKFGAHAMRIFRLLVDRGQLEQKAVADLAMVTKEEAREALYAMLKAGYLMLQDVPRTADHAPSRTFYTWRANIDLAQARLSADLYRAAANLHKRMCAELDRQRELMDVVEAVGPSQAVADRRSDEAIRLRGVVARLDAALLALDEQLAHFCDF